MSKKHNPNEKDSSSNKKDEKEIENPAYPPYPKDEDIYQQDEIKEGIDPNNPAKKKKRKLKNDASLSEIDEEEKRMEGDLDVPGSELDDEDEAVGEEDEENNFYSLDSDREEADRDQEE